MKIQWNKVTWYSKTLAVVVFVAAMYIGFRLVNIAREPSAAVVPVQVVNTPPSNLPNSYTNTTLGFSINYPSGFTVDDQYQYQELGPGKEINGVKFTIPASLAEGTNLSDDSYISVESIPQTTADTCSAALFIPSSGLQGPDLQTLNDNGTIYSFVTSSDAAAGNRYDETVYALSDVSSCIAIRYFIHYGAFENYPAGSVKQFNEASIVNQFDQIRRTLVLAPSTQ